MGQGGDLVLFNATPYEWRKTHEHSYQMKHWAFPDSIPAHTAVAVYVEFDDGFPQLHPTDDAGEVYYALAGLPAGQCTFYLQTRYKGPIQARFPEFATTVTRNADSAIRGLLPPQGFVPTTKDSVLGPNEVVDLGWRHNGHVSFVLAGESGDLRLLADALSLTEPSVGNM